MVTATGREQTTAKQFLDAAKKALDAAQGFVITTLPRGDLQVAQPANLPDALLKAYARGFHSQDCLSWQTIVKQRPMRPQDCWGKEAFRETPYFREFLEPQELTHVIAVPLAAPVLEGYPGAVHLCRTADQGPFTEADAEQLVEMAQKFDAKVEASRYARSGACSTKSGGSGRGSSSKRGGGGGKRGSNGDSTCLPRPSVRLCIVDGNQRPKFPGGAWSQLDERLRNQMVEAARRRLNVLNGQEQLVDRLLLPDSDGDTWTFRLVTYKRYPALGEGSFSFFCLQPDCAEWGVVKPADFNADAELARLVPAMKFMQQEFSRGPTLVEIAKTVGLSPFHFHRRFSELLGLTPKQFLLECQINKAKAELIAREKELVQIAKECGFAHQSHFTSRFKQATGLTPTRWRRMATERQEASDN